MAIQPLYLTLVTCFKPTGSSPTPIELAAVPLFAYILAMIFSLTLQRKLTVYFEDRMYMMLLAIVVTAFSSVPLSFLGESTQNWAYPLIGVQGIGIAIMLNTATAMISDMIGQDADNSAFVYGSFGLFDKSANGILVFILVAVYSENVEAIRFLMSAIPTGCSILCFIFAWMGSHLYSDRLAEISEKCDSDDDMADIDFTSSQQSPFFMKETDSLK